MRDSEFYIRPVDTTQDEELQIVAARMRLTLMEVLGEDEGSKVASIDWLSERARYHLDPTSCTGEILVADCAGKLLGHVIMRVDVDEQGESLGYFSTTYVDPPARRLGVADALLQAGEQWFKKQGQTRAITNTSEANTPLIQLYEKNGYVVAKVAPHPEMVRLLKEPL